MKKKSNARKYSVVTTLYMKKIPTLSMSTMTPSVCGSRTGLVYQIINGFRKVRATSTGICFMPTKNWNGKKILKFNYREFKGGRLEVPINASSCCGMFSWVTLPEGFQIGGLFNTRGIKDMNLMFAGCVMPKGFSLGDHFHTKEVEDMRYMFYQSSVSEAFDFGKIFDTSHVMNM